MKKTVTVNLNGRVFTMDEDAYRLLDNYLNNLRIYFRKEEGASEIIADFEARIEELFSERVRLGYEVITIEQVEEVIARVGKPDDFADREETSTVEEEKEKEKQTYYTEPKEVKKRFFRNTDDKLLGGICSGIAAYFGWDVSAVRIVFIILLFASSSLIPFHHLFWFSTTPFSSSIVIAYIIVWIVVPGARTAEQKLQMRGRPITVENIGKTVAAEIEAPTTYQRKGCLAGFIDLFVAFLKVIAVGFGCLIGLPLLFVLVIVIIVLFAVLFGVGGEVLQHSGFVIVDHPILATITFILVLGIPVIALLYGIIAYFAKLKPVSRAVKFLLLGIWILSLIILLFSGFRINKDNWFRVGNWSYWDDTEMIQGNGILSEAHYTLNEPVDYVIINEGLFAKLQIEQIGSDTSSIVINGDENLIDKIKYELRDGKLYLSSGHHWKKRDKRYHPTEHNVIVRLQTAGLKGIKSSGPGDIQLNTVFTGKEFEIKMNGPGRFQANSLFVESLKASSEGIASIELSGKAQKADFDMEGIGTIDALELVSDSVYANVNGIGSVRCNPTEYLKGHLNGVGKITYKEEPKTKNTTSIGIGKIGKE